MATIKTILMRISWPNLAFPVFRAPLLSNSLRHHCTGASYRLARIGTQPPTNFHTLKTHPITKGVHNLFANGTYGQRRRPPPTTRRLRSSNLSLCTCLGLTTEGIRRERSTIFQKRKELGGLAAEVATVGSVRGLRSWRKMSNQKVQFLAFSCRKTGFNGRRQSRSSTSVRKRLENKLTTEWGGIWTLNPIVRVRQWLALGRAEMATVPARHQSTSSGSRTWMRFVNVDAGNRKAFMNSSISSAASWTCRRRTSSVSTVWQCLSIL